jgi:hypothetical protein
MGRHACTFPARPRGRDNFNVSAEEAPATARLLTAEGFRRARVEIPWGSLDYNDPSRLEPQTAATNRS